MIIETFNSNISDAINKSDPLYQTWFGRENYTPEVEILQSSDINCGAICNELEYARMATDYWVKSLDIDSAESKELEELINGFIDLPRRGNLEVDENYRNRFKFLAVQNTNHSRTTKWAILDAIRYFVNDVTNTVQVLELFDTNNLHFEIRLEGINDISDALFLDNTEFGFLDSNFLGGATVGDAITFLNALVNRIKAAGVDFDIRFIDQYRFVRASDAFIGAIQMYRQSNAVIKSNISFTKISNAEIL